jgi:hypothetical protein
MSDGLHNLVGRKQITRTLNGKQYTFRVMVLADHAEKEAYILGLKPDPLASLAKLPANMPSHVRQSVVDAAMKSATRAQFVTRHEEQEFDESLHGLAWSLWRSLRDNHADFGKGGAVVYTAPSEVSYSLTPAQGVQKALDLIEEVGSKHLTDLMNIRDGVEEKTDLGN